MIKQIYQRVLPLALRNRLHPFIHPRVVFVEHCARRLARGVVQFGPFKGMKIPSDLGPSLIPVLLGTYELELHPAFERLKGRRFETILDVGGGVGYYAVGCALWQPHAKVVAWESDATYYHPKISSLARANGVSERIEVRGFCDTKQLQEFESAMPNAFLIMDTEGYEATILDPVAVPSLKQTTILVEYHDNLIGNCGAELQKRFESTHAITHFEPRHRTAHDYPIKQISKNGLLRDSARLVITERPTWREGRHGWLLLEPNQ